MALLAGPFAALFGLLFLLSRGCGPFSSILYGVVVRKEEDRVD